MANRPMENPERQMPVHVEAAYKDAVDNIIFLKRQQWVATNYALLVYAAIFVISAQYFSRTDFARNALGIVAIATSGSVRCFEILTNTDGSGSGIRLGGWARSGDELVRGTVEAS